MNPSLLIPFHIDEVIAGDHHEHYVTTFARMMTPIVAFMENLYATVHFWYAPKRILWSHYVNMMGEQVDPNDSINFTMPQLGPIIGGFPEQSIFDCMGLPTNADMSDVTALTSLPLRMYNKLWNDEYRDENLQDSIPIMSSEDGPDSPGLYTLQRRGKRKFDPFTSALPWPQKFSAPQIPIQGSGVVEQLPATIPLGIQRKSDGTVAATGNLAFNGFNTTDSGGNGVSYDPNGSLVTDPTGMYTLVNDIRQAFQIQKLLERDARGGTRYVELIPAHFGVVVPDYRLQRCEYLGGGETRINVNPVPQTSGSPATPDVVVDTPQGNLAAFATFSHKGIGYSKSFVEPGYILGLISIRADITYQNALEKFWKTKTRYDEFWPEFMQFPEQPITCGEVNWTGVPADDEDTFGYQEYGYQWRYKASRIGGIFKSTAVGSLDYWHAAQDFGTSKIELNENFVIDDAPIGRMITTPGEPYFQLDVWNRLHSTRSMTTQSIPGYVDHY